MALRRPVLGRIAETIAEAWLRARGYRIVARRRRIAGVEVDIVARRPGLDLLVEVKWRSSRLGASVPLETLVSTAQRRRLARAASAWASSAAGPRTIRVDLVIVRPRLPWPSVTHVPDISPRHWNE